MKRKKIFIFILLVFLTMTSLVFGKTGDWVDSTNGTTTDGFSNNTASDEDK